MQAERSPFPLLFDLVLVVVCLVSGCFPPSFPGLLSDVLVSGGIVSKKGHNVIQIFLEADNVLFLDLCGSSIDVLAL